MIFLENIDLLLKGPVIFTNIITSNVIIFSINSQVHLSNYFEFSFSEGNECLSIRYVVLEENTLLNITANKFLTIFGLMSFSQLYHWGGDVWCLFQYVSNHLPNSSAIHDEFPLQRQSKKYLIILQDNRYGQVLFRTWKFTISHCDWIDDSAFMESDPHEINKMIVLYVNNSFVFPKHLNLICHCIDDQYYDCKTDELGLIYPGHTLTL